MSCHEGSSEERPKFIVAVDWAKIVEHALKNGDAAHERRRCFTGRKEVEGWYSPSPPQAPEMSDGEAALDEERERDEQDDYRHSVVVPELVPERCERNTGGGVGEGTGDQYAAQHEWSPLGESPSTYRLTLQCQVLCAAQQFSWFAGEVRSVVLTPLPDHFPFSIGAPAACHARQPPAIDATFV